MKVDRLAERPDDLRSERVEPDEKRLELLAIGQRITARPPRNAVVGVNADDRRLLMVARNGVPCGSKRRVELDAIASGLDGRDPHQLPP